MITYDTTTALVVVDLLNEYTDPAGSGFVDGAASLVPRVNIEIMRALSAGALILYAQDSRPEPGWGAELHPGLQVAGPLVRKGPAEEDGCSAFTVRDPESGDDAPSPLHAALEERGITRVVVVGLTLEGSVRKTALDAAGSFATTVLPEATVAVDLEPGDGGRAIDEMRNAGVVIA